MRCLLLLPAIMLLLVARGTADDDAFTGKERSEAKTSIVPEDKHPVEDFADLPALVKALPSDADMEKMHIKLHDPRVKEEERNVRVHAFLFYVKHESDGDYHVILGATKDGGPYIITEVSGLPPEASDSYKVLAKAREALRAILPDGLPGAVERHYTPINPPLAVVVTGSTFFDVDPHRGEGRGPKEARVETKWEIHPITDIQREDVKTPAGGK